MNRAKQRNFILKLFFSIEKFKNQSFELKCFSQLIKRKYTKNAFKKFLDLRKKILDILNLKDSKITPPILSDLYLNKHELKVYCDSISDDLYNEIKFWVKNEEIELRKLRILTRKSNKKKMVEEIKQKETMFKLGSSNSGLILWKTFLPFLNKDLEDQTYLIKKGRVEHDTRVLMQKKALELDDSYDFEANDVLEIDENGKIITVEKTKEEEISEKRYAKLLDLEAQKRKIIEEIQEYSSKINWKRQASVMMLGLTKLIDEICEKGCEMLGNCTEERIIKYKKIIVDDKEDDALKREMFRAIGGIGGLDYFENGSRISKSNYKIASRNLDVAYYPIAQELKEKARAYNTHMSRYHELVLFLIKKNHQLFKEKKKKSDFVQEKVMEQNKGIMFSNIEIEAKRTQKMEVNRENEEESVKMDEVIEEIYDGKDIDEKFDNLMDRIEHNGDNIEEEDDYNEEDEVFEIGEEEVLAALEKQDNEIKNE